MENKILECALNYAHLGWSVFPCHSITSGKCSCGNNNCQNQGKHPRTKNGFIDATTNETIITEWWSKWPEANIGCATGAISGIIVLDLDKKHGRTSKEFSIPVTVSTRTGGGGEHFFFKYPGYYVKSTNGQILGLGVDIKGDGGYVILSPSLHLSGNTYDWMVSPHEIEPVGVPEWLKKALGKQMDTKSNKLWQKGVNGASEGNRNETATSMAGKIRSSLPIEIVETVGWSGLVSWNQNNTPPISEDELRGIWNSIAKYDEKNNLDNTAKGQAETLLKIIEGKKNIVLFHDDKKDGYISIEVGNHKEIMALRSKSMKRWLTRELWEARKKPITSEALDSVVRVLESKACHEGQKYNLQNRLAFKDGELWYDLVNDRWQAVRINVNGWSIEDNTPILFNRYSHNQEQIHPAQNGDIRLILKYINLPDKNQQLLFLVYLVSCFIPDFPHPILVIFGPQGSSKTTLSKLLRLIVDPSFIEVASMPTSQKELVQALAHHSFLFFDNVSYISEEVSDTLCKAITGSGFIKRELYSNDEDIIYRFKRSIGMNGINLVSTKPDLLDRSLLLELERIDDSQRKQEKELMDNFMEDLPLILGDVFHIISSTLRIKPSIRLVSTPRMADFTLWACAIAEAIGYRKEEFLEAYKNNIAKQTETILNENIVATVLLAFMEERVWQKWEGTATELLDKLTNHADFSGIDTYDKYWPKAPQSLSRAINVLKVTLRSADISINISAGQKRKITIERISPKANLSLIDRLIANDSNDVIDDIFS